MKKYISKSIHWIFGYFSELHKELKNWRQAYIIRRPLILILMATAVGIVAAKQAGFLLTVSPNDISHWNGSYVTLVGTIGEFPDRKTKGMSYVISAEMIDTETGTWAVQGRVFVQTFISDPNLACPGERLRIRGKLQTPPRSNIPGSFDVSQWLALKDIYSVMYVGRDSFQVIGNSGQQTLKRTGWQWHQNLMLCFEHSLSTTSAVILSGLAIGERPRRHPEIRKAFMNTGTMHILVASGSNMAFVVGLWFLMVRFLFRLSRRVSLALCIPAVWSYALIVGLDAPIVRSAAMATLLILYTFLRRYDSFVHLWSIAALSILISHPKTLFDVGFQMSFVTTFGLIHWSTIITEKSAHQPLWKKTLLWFIFATLCAQIWLFPISANIFKKIIPLAPLFNVIILPLSAAGLTCAVLLVISSMNPTLFGWTSWLVEKYLTFLYFVVETLAQKGGFAIWLGSLLPISIMGFYLVCFCVIYTRHSRWAQVGSIVGILFFIGGWAFKSQIKNQPSPTRLTWLDVGRQSSLIIERPQQPTLLINPPDQEQMERVVFPYTSEVGIHIGTETHIPRNAYRLFQVGSTTLVVGNPLSLSHQRELLKMPLQKIDILQTRFSPKTIWDPQFIERFQPMVLIETGFDTVKKPSMPPWKNRTVIVPQKLGVWVYEPSQ